MPKSIIEPKLLKILCCPACKGNLRLNEKQSNLTCVKCKSVYPIEDGIPIMLPKT